jgi:hypothetical protein
MFFFHIIVYLFLCLFTFLGNLFYRIFCFLAGFLCPISSIVYFFNRFPEEFLFLRCIYKICVRLWSCPDRDCDLVFCFSRFSICKIDECIDTVIVSCDLPEKAVRNLYLCSFVFYGSDLNQRFSFPVLIRKVDFKCCRKSNSFYLQYLAIVILPEGCCSRICVIVKCCCYDVIPLLPPSLANSILFP